MSASSTSKLISSGYVLAGLTNIIGILVVSQGFSQPLFHNLSPEVFGPFGAFMIMVWGLAYLAASRRAAELAGIAFVFAFEKAVYVVTWVVWMREKSDMLDMVQAESALVGMFYGSYGLLDLAFGLFFLWVGVRALKVR